MSEFFTCVAFTHSLLVFSSGRAVLEKGVLGHCQRCTHSQYITRLFVLIIACEVEQTVYNNKQPYRNIKWEKRENIKIIRVTTRRHMIDEKWKIKKPFHSDNPVSKGKQATSNLLLF